MGSHPELQGRLLKAQRTEELLTGLATRHHCHVQLTEEKRGEGKR